MKTILYHGADHDFFNQLLEAAKMIPHCQAYMQGPEKGVLLERTFELRPQIIIVDTAFVAYLSEELRQIKMLSGYKSTVFVGYCKDALEAKEGETLLVSGMHLYHMKDADFETFIRDCFDMAFSDESKRYDFARAMGLEIPLDISFLSSLTSVCSDSFCLETDLDISEEIFVQVPMSADETLVSVRVKDKLEGRFTAPFTKSYHMNFTFPGPWDEVTENSLSPERVETWIGLRKDKFDPRSQKIAIFSRDEKLIRGLSMSSGSCWYQVYSSSEDVRSSLLFSLPGIVFFDLQNDDGVNLEALEEILRVLQEMTTPPMVTVFGSKSESAPLKKLFGYEFLISYSGKLELQMFQAMEKKFLEKYKQDNEEYFLAPADPEKVIKIRKKVILTSITERDLTFIMEDSIPYFSVACIDLPCPAYVTIVPAEGQLPPSKQGTHYRGIIHGLDDEKLTRLRKIVNQMIYHPLKELTVENTRVMLKHDYVPKNIPIETPAENLRASVTNETADDRFTLNRNIRGKSKL
ncbi:MAG TPA: hypothetical protein VNJ08_10315 [Bacteriovoracaceae bacterium]|nr:hypothetical protein [Bacteriovoracaceae bacterium]